MFLILVKMYEFIVCKVDVNFNNLNKKFFFDRRGDPEPCICVDCLVLLHWKVVPRILLPTVFYHPSSLGQTIMFPVQNDELLV